MRWLGLTLVVALGACADQWTLDKAQLDVVATSCGVTVNHFDAAANSEHVLPANRFSPFRRFGQWWLERRSRERNAIRHYTIDVPEHFKEDWNTDTAASFRRRIQNNRKIDCIREKLKNSGIAVGSSSPSWL